MFYFFPRLHLNVEEQQDSDKNHFKTATSAPLMNTHSFPHSKNTLAAKGITKLSLSATHSSYSPVFAFAVRKNWPFPIATFSTAAIL
jgi:hypothetical protein